MGSQHLQRTTAIVGKVATKGRKQLHGKPAFAEDDSNSREGSNKREADIMKRQQLQRTTARAGKVGTKGRKQLNGKPAYADDDSNSRKANQYR
jgi:hypothetical protein